MLWAPRENVVDVQFRPKSTDLCNLRLTPLFSFTKIVEPSLLRHMPEATAFRLVACHVKPESEEVTICPPVLTDTSRVPSLLDFKPVAFNWLP